ncbi:hypothetical protein ACJ8S7_005099 [Klebsiella pneumoniae]|nr:hypothetical protein [Klebsiella pneumoniae]
MIEFFIGLCIGQAVVMFFTMIMYKRMARSNALIANESDRFYSLMRVAYKMLHHKQQEEFDNCSEVQRINEQFYANKENINKKGVY